MNNFKKFVAACLALVMVLSVVAFVACNADNPDPSPTPDDGNKNPPAPPVDYGKCTIANVTLYVTSNGNSTFAKLSPTFSDPTKAETLAYRYDDSKIAIADGIVTTKTRRNSTVAVTAHSEHFDASFNVNIKYIDFTADDRYNYTSGSGAQYVQYDKMADRCKTRLTAGSTVVLGDSFTDDYFIGDFLADYKSRNGASLDIFNIGMSGTTSFQWEAMCTGVIGSKTAPKNLVINLGTNDLYCNHSANDTVGSLQRLVMYLHTAYPTANVYLFSVNDRVGERYPDDILTVNSAMNNWATQWSWLTTVNSRSVLTADKLLEDGIHPNADGYEAMFAALVAAGCKF